MRQAAVRELAEGWKDDPETLPILRTRAQTDKSNLVRQVAVQELARGWKDLAGMFEFLRDQAIHNPFNYEDSWDDNPRQSALEAILENYPDSPQVRKLLIDRANNDSDQELREFAKQKLTELGIQNPESIE